MDKYEIYKELNKIYDSVSNKEPKGFILKKIILLQYKILTLKIKGDYNADRRYRVKTRKNNELY